MLEGFDEEDLNILYSEGDSDAYVVTKSTSKLKLLDGPTPEIAPLYMDLETGEAVYPEGITPGDADGIARYVLEESPTDTPFFTTEKDDERWREEFSGLFDHETEVIKTQQTELDYNPAERPYPY